MKRYKKPQTVRLTRDRAYVLYPIRSSNQFDYIASFCTRDFERVTGVRLEPGESVKVRITVEEA